MYRSIFAHTRFSGLWRMVNLLRSSIALLAMLLTLFMPAAAIPPSRSLATCRLDTWGIRDGLPGYDITALAQTPDGYLWIGTTQGLLRFDGVSFTLFDRHNTPGLTNATIRGLGVDKDGALLVGAEWCGYGRLINGAYVRANFPDDHWNATHLFHTSPDGALWVGYQGYAYFLREQHHVVDKITLPNGLYMTGIVDLRDNAKLVCSQYGGLYMISPTGVVSPYHTEPAITTNDFTSMAEMPDGSIWLGTDTNGIYHIVGNHWTHLTTANGLASNTIHCLFVDSHRRLWIGTNAGIDTPSGSGFAHFGANSGLGSDNVSAILEDHEGNIWVASGIYLNRFASTRFTPVGIGSSMMSKIEQVTTAANGSVLCGSRDGLWEFAPNAETSPRRLTDFRVDGAVSLRNGDLLIWWARDPYSSIVGEVRSRKLISQQIVRFNPIAAIPTQDGADVYSAFQDFQRFQSANTSKPLPAPSHRLVSVSGNLEIFDVKQAGDGSVWLGTTRGLGICKDGVGRILDLTFPNDTHILSIDTSDRNCLWLGTDKGLARVYGPGVAHPWSSNPSQFHITLYAKQDGLPSNNLLQILRDDSGSIWVGGYFGIASIDSRKLQSHDRHLVTSIEPRLFTSADGIRSFPCLRTPVKTSNGHLWFVGRRGLTVIDPQNLSAGTLSPPVQIEDAMANGTHLKLDSRTQVKPGAGTLIVHYAGLSYVQPEKVSFKYRLEGFDHQWIDAGSQRIATYTNLPPGAYRFRVIACNDQGIWNLGGASVSFTLQPHFYQTLWFKAVLAVVTLLAICALVVLRTRSIMRKARELEAKVAARTAELLDANAQLKNFEEELRIQNIQLTETQAAVLEQNDELQAMQAELEAQNDELLSVQAELESQNQELLQTQERLKAANAQLEALATTDGLTGLYNHRMFHEQLEQEWSRHTRYGTALSVILLDVDKFKQYNDSYGHPAGDEVLRKVAEILTATARKSDVVARYGGEEFVVIARESDARSATRLAERIRTAIEKADWPLRPVTGSFGVASVNSMIMNSSELIAEADAALYRSKNGGRNRVTHAKDRETATTPAP